MITKALIRKEALLRRDLINGGLKKTKEDNIRVRLFELPAFKTARSILLYASFKSEVDTFSLISYCMSNGKATVLPKTNPGENNLDLYEIKAVEELAPGYFGVAEPFVSEDRRINMKDIDMIVVPGVAFDEQCNRLGYGKGFYDKLLSGKNSPAFALAFEEQIVASLPCGPHDIKMNGIITDKRVISCHG